jgi:hypothetical protein
MIVMQFVVFVLVAEVNRMSLEQVVVKTGAENVTDFVFFK